MRRRSTMLNLTPKNAPGRRNAVARTSPRVPAQNLAPHGPTKDQRNHLEWAGRPRRASKPRGQMPSPRTRTNAPRMPGSTKRRRRQRRSVEQHRKPSRENKKNNQRAHSLDGAEERGEGVQARAPIPNSQTGHKTRQKIAHRNALAAHRLVLRKTRGRH